MGTNKESSSAGKAHPEYAGLRSFELVALCCLYVCNLCRKYAIGKSDIWDQFDPTNPKFGRFGMGNSNIRKSAEHPTQRYRRITCKKEIAR